MATKTGIGVLPILLVVGGFIAWQNGALDGVLGGVEITGEGDSQIMYASSAKSNVKKCDPAAMLSTRQCDDLHVVILNAAKMPFIALNTKEAMVSGRPGILTMNRPKQTANRAVACPPSFPRPYGGSCDEYPMASTDEGGKGARAAEVPRRENLCQGGTYGAQYPKDGKKFLMVIIHPDQMATTPFTGADIAKDRGSC